MKMTKKLVWRLKETPTVSEVTELLREEIISKEEARDVLFSINDTTNSDNN